MINNNYVDVTSIIERVYRDTGFDLEINSDEVFEWTWDAITLIGAPQAFVDVVTNGLNNNPEPIVISNFRGQLPLDIYQIKLVIDYDTKMPYMCEHSDYNEDLVNLSYTDDRYTYSLRDGYIFTSQDDITLEISYKGFPTSPLGLPMIPDNIRYMKAVSAYITERIAKRLWLSDRLGRDKYQALEQEWLFYVASAKTAAQVPSVDKMEAIKNRWLRLKQNPNLHSTSFRYQAEKERLILHNNITR